MNNEDISRVERFRQFKNEIRGSARYLIVGLDIGKSMHHGFLGTATGETVKRGLRVENSARGFEHLLTSLQFYMDRDGFEDVVFGLEPTSVYHKPLAEFLIAHGHLVVYVTNAAIKKNRALLDGRWDKNDTKDSANAADLVAQGKCQYYDLPNIQLRDLRALIALRGRLKKQLHSCRVRIRNNLVAQYFPELDNCWNQAQQENLAIVRWCLSPHKISQLSFEDFFKTVTTANKGLRQHNRLSKIWQIAPYSIGCQPGIAMELEAKILVENIKTIEAHIATVDETIEDISVSFQEYQYLLSIPGFGPYVSAVVLAMIGTARRFDNTHQVLKFAGFDLNANRSGKKSQTAVPVISKKGNAALRYAVYQAALIASSLNAQFKDYYHQLLKGREREKGIRTKMRVKLAAKLLVIAWTLMKKKQAFDPSYLKAQ
jgi:transposase